MDVSRMLDSFQGELGSTLPALGGALLIVVVGWAIALVLRAGIRRSLGLLGLNERLRTATGRALDVEGGIAAVSYYVVLLVVMVAFFNALELERVSSSLQSLVEQIFGYAAKLAAGGVLLLIAWVIASLMRLLATRALATWRIDERLSVAAGVPPISESVGNVLYWLVMLIFLPAVLGALEMEGLLAPVQGLVDQILLMLPNVLAAGVIAGVGWFAARVLRDLVANLLAAVGADRLGQAAGFEGNLSLSRIGGLVVYVFVWVPALIAALNALEIEAISAPATAMLGTFMNAIPNLFAAVLILVVAYILSGFFARLAKTLLVGVGFDALPTRLGLEQAFPQTKPPSDLAERLIVLFVMLLASVEAANRLGFDRVADLISAMVEFGGQILLGIGIIGVGLWLANLARDAVARIGGGASLGALARLAIVGTVIAMGLRAMGVADDIVNLAFGLTLGAVAVAVALSFGLGGREAAGRQMEHWLARLREESSAQRRE
jgi:hypothetical protein